jgi:hypothetical protein
MRAFAVALIPLFLAACSASIKPNGDVSMRQIHAQDEWKAALVGTGAAAGMTGDAHAATDGSRTQVTLKLDHAQAGRSYPWHVHAGTCGTNGAVVGPGGAYPLAVIGGDGKATATANLNFPFSKTGAYYVNVHAAPNQMSTIVACAPLTK